MNLKTIFLLLACAQMPTLFAQQESVIKNDHFSIRIANTGNQLWGYTLNKKSSVTFPIAPPVFEIDGKAINAQLVRIVKKGNDRTLRNGVIETVFSGPFRADTSLHLDVVFRYAKDNPVMRYQYQLRSSGMRHLTKSKGADAIAYGETSLWNFSSLKEIRFSDYDEKLHAYILNEQGILQRNMDNGTTVMGPMLTAASTDNDHFLWAYEHGSQYPDAFLSFDIDKSKNVKLKSVKGNYLHRQTIGADEPFETVWFQLAGATGGEAKLSAHYRKFVLSYLNENTESRAPSIYYNTWGRQERVRWAGGKYLESINLDFTLKEIDAAHRMGIDVYVIDVGWFKKTGDWKVNTEPEFFPDTLKQVVKKIKEYNMKLGIWFNPVVAAKTSYMLAANRANQASWDGKEREPFDVWDTESSYPMCLVSSYWEAYAREIVRLADELNITYVKWDAVDQYGCNGAGHHHGSKEHSADERMNRYAYLMPLYLSKVVSKVAETHPEVIFDFDITENGRSVGLSFLSSGKYFAINNGPYFHNYDLAEKWGAPFKDGNANILVKPGPARTWFMRSILSYDKWIPSILFLTHYQMDDPPSSQQMNMASLILGQNGIWGEILKISPEGVRYTNRELQRYKKLSGDITLANPVVTGSPGVTFEVHEKINAQNGKGAVVLFATSKGKYKYVTENKVDANHVADASVKVTKDSSGRGVVQADFAEPGAKIIWWGIKD